MEQFSDIESIRVKLKQLDLERQIHKEQIKYNYNEYKEDMTSNLFSSTVFSLVKKIAFGLILKKFATK